MSGYIDTSIVVKWFREDEEHREEALKLRDRVIDFESEFVMSYYGVLELTRALVKAGFPHDRIEGAFSSIVDLYEIGALQSVDIADALYMAKDMEIELNLYAGDALHLASAIVRGCGIFWSEDKHHLKNKTKEYMEKHGVIVKSLEDV